MLKVYTNRTKRVTDVPIYIFVFHILDFIFYKMDIVHDYGKNKK